MTTTFSLYVGVDIAATTFTATWATDPASAPRAIRFDQTASGYAAFQQQLAATGMCPAATLVALEATGSYWVALATHFRVSRHAPQWTSGMRFLSAPMALECYAV